MRTKQYKQIQTNLVSRGIPMRSTRRLAPILILTVLLASSCAPAMRAPDNEGEEPRSSSTRLIRVDLMESGETNLLDAIDRLRPRWLQVRSRTSVQGAIPIVVYRDNARIGGIEVLRSMRIEGIQEVRFVNATDATTRWGMGVGSGVIEVISSRVRRND